MSAHSVHAIAAILRYMCTKCNVQYSVIELVWVSECVSVECLWTVRLCVNIIFICTQIHRRFSGKLCIGTFSSFRSQSNNANATKTVFIHIETSEQDWESTVAGINSRTLVTNTQSSSITHNFVFVWFLLVFRLNICYFIHWIYNKTYYWFVCGVFWVYYLIIIAIKFTVTHTHWIRCGCWCCLICKSSSSKENLKKKQCKIPINFYVLVYDQ